MPTVTPTAVPRSGLSRRQIWAAFLVALTVDALQMALGPLGWFLLDQGLDLAAMLATMALLGFHPLLLPTFILELLPVTDLLPTWTGCVALVIALKRKQTAAAPATEGKVIDV